MHNSPRKTLWGYKGDIMKTKFNFKLAAGLILLSILAIVIFRTAKQISLSAYIAVIVIYTVITLVTALCYISQNRGLVGTAVTYDLLPKEWSEEEKKAFMEDYRARRAKSKKLLIILLPMIAAFFFEILDIYLIEELITKILK